MKIGIMSDSHDRIEKVRKAIELFEDENVAEAIHCGDFTAPFMIKELEKFAGNVHIVFGNIDDKYRTTKKAEQSENEKLHGEHANIELGGKKIGVVHEPEIAEYMAKSQDFDIVFHGHNHKKGKKEVNNSLLVNPGELMGRKGKTIVAIYHTEQNEIEFREVG